MDITNNAVPNRTRTVLFIRSIMNKIRAWYMKKIKYRFGL